MKQTLLFFCLSLSSFCLVTSCKKTDSGPSGGDLYFNCGFNGNNYEIGDTYAFGTVTDANFINGHLMGTADSPKAPVPVVALTATWNNKTTITKDDVLALAGKTLYFDDPQFDLKFSLILDYSGTSWEQVDTNDHNYSINISTVTVREKSNHTQQYSYTVTGTAHAILTKNGAYAELSDGEFRMVIGGGSD
jgi:hypothetical protein